MSVEMFDLGRRLRAAAEGRAVWTRTTTLHPLPADPVIVGVQGQGQDVELRLARAGVELTAEPACAIQALADLGVGLSLAAPPTLVVATGAHLDLLVSLAREDQESPTATSAAAVVGWWQSRSEHPTSGAVQVLTRDLAQRMVLGVSPQAEEEPASWAAWLGLSSTGTALLAELAQVARSGDPVPGAESLPQADQWSWNAAVKRAGQGKDWRAVDTFAEAALGLRTRCDAAELFDSLRLDDPAEAQRATYTGDAVTGAVVACGGGEAVLVVPRALSRLRPGAKVTGWHGTPDNISRRDLYAVLDAELSQARALARHLEDRAEASGTAADLDAAKQARAQAQALFREIKEMDSMIVSSAVVAGSRIRPGGMLEVRLVDVVCRPREPQPGAVLTVRPARIAPSLQDRGRRMVRTSVLTSGNWLAGRGRPVPVRRPVPLAITVAAAD